MHGGTAEQGRTEPGAWPAVAAQGASSRSIPDLYST